MQPMFLDEAGLPRFVPNKIVRFLLDEASAGRKCDLNRIAMRAHLFSQAEWEQFYQLIGYSLKGYHELRLVSDESALAATTEAEKLGATYLGCRSEGCGWHSGVPTAEPGQPTPDPPMDVEEDEAEKEGD